MCPIISKAWKDGLWFHVIGRRPHQRWSGPSGGCGLVSVPYEPPANGIVHAVALQSTNPASWLSTNPALQGDGAEYSCWRDEYSHSDNQRAAQLMLISSSSIAVTTEPHQWTKRSKQQQQLCQLKRSEAYFNVSFFKGRINTRNLSLQHLWRLTLMDRSREMKNQT